MSSKPEFVTAPGYRRAAYGGVKAELVGGMRLEGLAESTDALPRVRISPEAFQALKGLRNRGETIREVVERLIFEATAKP